MNARTLELFADKEFLGKVMAMPPEEAQEEFATNGSDITIPELYEIVECAKKISQNDEFNENDLEQVVGGGKNEAIWKATGFVVAFGVMACVCGW